MASFRSISAAALACVLALSGCDSEATDAPTTASSPSSTPSAPEPPSAMPTPGGFVEMEFSARDGEVRRGRLFGDGQVAIALSHMGNPGNDQDDWKPTALRLAEAGYLVLTYDNRERLNSSWNDVLGAVDYLRSLGAETVIAGGASIGAMASLRAAEEPDSAISGVIWLAGVLNNSGYYFKESDITDVACPVAIISAKDDSYGAADDARQLRAWLPETSELLIIDSSQHGTNIFADGGNNARALRKALVSFVDDVAAGPTTQC